MKDPHPTLEVQGRPIGENHPTYCVADIAANHDGDLERAKDLIHLAADAGADAAKFQHFQAKTIVSDIGFRALGSQQSHQASWGKSVFEVYRDASVDWNWTETLLATCVEAGIPFFTTPYSLEVIDFIDEYVPAYKIGSGDITWLELVQKVASKGKPYFIATGASTLDEVHRAVSAALRVSPRLALMQCNTNYTASLENFKYIQLNVLGTYRHMYPSMILGLSDHTPGHATVLGAVALGARVVEKHFTDDCSRTGPDHAFSMDPTSWREMVDRTRELELAMGTGVKCVEANEAETVVLQRRSLRAARRLAAGDVLRAGDLVPLRPCPPEALEPHHLSAVIGRSLRRSIEQGACLYPTDLDCGD